MKKIGLIVLVALALCLLALALPKTGESKADFQSLDEDSDGYFDFTIEYHTYDGRFTQLNQFFGTLPAGQYTNEFIETSDKYNLDYRLLPTIAHVESTSCTFNFRLNNCFGYGNMEFNSVPEAIDYIANDLANGRYAGLDTWGKLERYNGTSYASRVINLMGKI